MPIIQAIQPESGGTIIAWHVTENTAMLMQNYANWLSHADIENVESFSIEKRKVEYLIPRIILQMYARQKGLLDCWLSKDSHNRPVIVGHPIDISITHSHDKCVVYIHPNRRVGIDLEKIQQKIVRIGSKFLVDQEAALIGDSALLHTLAWSIKEAAFKLVGEKGLSLKKHVCILAYTADTVTVQVDHSEYPYPVIGYYTLWDDMLLSWITLPYYAEF